MFSIPLFIVILFNFILTLYLLNRYGNFGRQNVLITISVFISWFFSFNVIFILPLDVTSTIYNQCTIRYAITNVTTTTTTTEVPFISNIVTSSDGYHSQLLSNVSSSIIIENSTQNNNDSSHTNWSACAKPWSYVSKNVLLNLWKFIYWSSQVLTWIILPIFQSYSMSGEFTAIKKIESSMKDNLKYYCSFGLLFLVFLFYYASEERVTFEGLKIFCISASNTFGLFLLVILMGYGLVDIPRSFLKNYHCNYQYKLNYLYFKVGKINEERYEANCHLEDLLDELRLCYIRITSENRYGYLMRKLQIIIDKCPDSFREDLSRLEMMPAGNTVDSLSEKQLVNLNAKIKRAIQASHRTEVQYKLLVQQAAKYEAIIKDLNSSFRSDEVQNVSAAERWLRKYVPKTEFLIQRRHVIIYKMFFLFFGYVFTFFSIIIIWSEFTFSIKSIPISIFALIIKIIDYDYFWIEMFSMLSIAYMSCCCYYTIFKIRIFNYYYLAKHHQTDEYSLIFSGMLLCRLASPLCLNFLSLIHFDSHVSHESIEEETSFTQIMGHMDTISYISDYIFIYLPLFMALFCVATLFKLDRKLVSYFGFDQYSLFDEITQELVREGEKLVKRELKKQAPTSSVPSYKGHHHQQRDANSNLSRSTSREKLLSNEPTSPTTTIPEMKKNLVVDVERNIFDDI